MDNINRKYNIRNIIIIVLIAIILLSFIGINILAIVGDQIFKLTNSGLPYSGNIFGKGLNYTSNTIANGAKYFIDLINEIINKFGNFLQKKSSDDKEVKDEEKKTAETFINTAPYDASYHEPSPGEISIQKPISAAKDKWCLVDSNKCVNVGDESKCITGQLYPSQIECLSHKF
jgi:hypothetical protein